MPPVPDFSRIEVSTQDITGPNQTEASETMTANQIHRCDCGKICMRKENLRQHKKTCTVETAITDFSKSFVYTCGLCSPPCTTALALRQHTGSAKCKQRQVAKSKSVSLTLALSESETTQVKYECKKCKGCFKTKKGLASHQSRSLKCKVSNYILIEVVLLLFHRIHHHK